MMHPNDIPRPVMLLIFRELCRTENGWRTLVRMRRVSRHFRRLSTCQWLWKCACLDHWPDLLVPIPHDDVGLQDCKRPSLERPFHNDAMLYQCTRPDWPQTFCSLYIRDQRKRLADATSSRSLLATRSVRQSNVCQHGCGRPECACLCSHLPPASEQICNCAVHLLILVHPKCQTSTGTVQILVRLFKHVTVIFGKEFTEDHPEFREAYNRNPNRLLLFPARNARDLSSGQCPLGGNDEENIPSSNGATTLIIIDGSWSQARYIYRWSPMLNSGAVPCVKLGQNTPKTIYAQLKREPNDTAMSTAEATGYTMTSLGHRICTCSPEMGQSMGDRQKTILDPILRGVQRIIDVQKSFEASRVKHE